ncbi:hypothetical protein SNE40_000528 [Patella caerulea]|uniref:Reverse transcriptase domain-containing protein n=1 Tax=Patella caerulea TaxID=87958 RepID=A0AAN8KGR2_PATCE
MLSSETPDQTPGLQIPQLHSPFTVTESNDNVKSEIRSRDFKIGFTPVNAVKFRDALFGYDESEINFIFEGFMNGFPLNITLENIRPYTNNLKSALELPDIVQLKLDKELKAGRIAGPFDEKPFENFHASPLGVVEKKVAGTYRLIHHLSYPEGESVNDSIRNDFCTVQYSTIQNAIQVIKQLGRHSQLAKADIEAAYRIVPLHPSNFHFLGFIWKEKYYYDRCLPMGLSESCKLFERISSALEWIAVNKLGASGVVHVLDDFLFVERTVNNCTRTRQRFECLCKAVGIPLAPEKTCGPSTNIQFLGITLDSDLMEARLPADKLSKCWDLLDRYSNKKKISLRDLQSMIGTLQFATSVVLPGRTFLRRLIDLTIGIRRRFYMIRLNSGARSDIAIWKNILENYNGQTFFLYDVWLTTHSFRIGGASLAAHNGLSDSQIRQLGRWRSDAFRKYIRPSSLK